MPRTRISQILTVAGFGLTVLLPSSPAAAFQDAASCTGPAFTRVGEIKSKDGRLQAVMKVLSGSRNVPNASEPRKLRYFEGYNVNDRTQRWPADPAAAGPGPTLRAEVGDVVQITLLNQVKVEDFGGSLDSGEQGRNNGCDQVTVEGDKNFYPATDRYPNCFHGSSSANLHFHGTHVTPSTTGDNVLINVRPNPKVTEGDVGSWFQEIFQHCDLGHQPKRWEDLPQGWRDFQQTLLEEYDRTAPYVGPGRNPDGHGLPPDLRLWPQNKMAIDHGIWPQWYVGSYPYCFQLPKYTVDREGRSNVQMGQAPGTHWYHSHKHGSTSINLFNGLAGAFIITDNSPTGYDGKLQAFYGGKLEERVLVLQQIADTLNLESAASGGPPLVLVNGQLAPTLTLRPGEVQLWRWINATVQNTVRPDFAGAALQFRRTAQDGVQLAPENYGDAQNGTQTISLVPANRVDVLVQAPSTAGCYTLKYGKNTLALIKVTGDPVSPAMGFPAQADFPELPPFLKDIQADEVRLRREIVYGARQPEAPKGQRAITQFTIDGKQFEDQVIDQLMLLGTTEEWTLINTDTIKTIAHPFHIHVNPFQIVEIFDPMSGMTEPKKLSPPFVWWDTFSIPRAVKSSDGTVVPGYFKMRTRFVDFTGRYVQHCHILAHEDRGMMQLLEVADNKTVLKHH